MAETTAWPTWAWPTPQTLAKDFSTMSIFIMARWDDDHDYGGEGDDDDQDYRVAKCHRYGRYICVKIFEGWGKKCRRPHSFVKWSSLRVNCTNFYEVLSLYQLYLIEVSAFSPRRSHFSQFQSVKVSNLSWFSRFSRGKIWFERFDLCKKIDISQLQLLNGDVIARQWVMAW